MISSKRSADELPGDPRRLNLEYRTWHFVGSEGDENGFDEWHVSIWSNRFLDRPKWSAAKTAQDDIGSMRLFRLRMDDRFSPFPFADAESYDTDLSNLALGVYDLGRGGYRQEFRDAMTSADGDLLVLFDVRLDDAWRGFGLEPVLVSEAVWTLADGCCAVLAADPLWESVGFRRRANPLGHLMDPATEEARDLRNERRRDLDALADAYRRSLRAGR
ncbi:MULTISPECIES: hypothetical protein [unclassified Streptomyces]|uniref:hypothetical protein n=1 Tax=unclassified Streptomyces TaxID=2593676 RepID=UPI00234B9C05|nr:hypothetical protein [Streptomyces sp. M92]WCN06822.1 hypothetical protein M6G08_34670 [Streptomyces sp. M92]